MKQVFIPRSDAGRVFWIDNFPVNSLVTPMDRKNRLQKPARK